MDPIYVFISTDFGENRLEQLRTRSNTTFRENFFEKKLSKITLTCPLSFPPLTNRSRHGEYRKKIRNYVHLCPENTKMHCISSFSITGRSCKRLCECRTMYNIDLECVKWKYPQIQRSTM